MKEKTEIIKSENKIEQTLENEEYESKLTYQEKDGEIIYKVEMKEKTADEMFEELGYIKSEEPLDFFGEMIPYITYKDNMDYKTIDFNLKNKLLCMSCVNKNFNKILQAINKKVEELGWLDE